MRSSIPRPTRPTLTPTTTALKDGVEKFGANPTDPNDSDSDNDGLLDGQEDANHNGVKDANETDPNKADTDSDKMPDGYEKGKSCLNALVADGNLDADGDGVSNYDEFLAGTDPCLCNLMYDFDPDGEITVFDVLVMVHHWDETPASAGWDAKFDVDFDGRITVIDFMIVVGHIGDKCN